jgi:hypothetical protein
MSPPVDWSEKVPFGNHQHALSQIIDEATGVGVEVELGGSGFAGGTGGTGGTGAAGSAGGTGGTGGTGAAGGTGGTGGTGDPGGTGGTGGIGGTGGTGATGLATETINFLIDGGGATITPGIKGDVVVDFDAAIQSASLRECSDVGVATAIVDIWKVAAGDWPATDSDSICDATPPTLSGGGLETDATLASWTTDIAAGDILRYNVDSCSGGNRLLVSLKVQRT